MRLKLMVKLLLIFKSGKERLELFVLDASNRRIVAERVGEVKTISPQITHTICVSRWLFVCGKRRFG